MDESGLVLRVTAPIILSRRKGHKPLARASGGDCRMKHVDMVVIGTGPAGQKAAIQAAKLGKQVTLVERNNVLGGTCINTGTIPSKALREAVLQLVRIGKGGFYGEGHASGTEITIEELTGRCQNII